MYQGPIVDPHHHLWDLSMGKHPWLAPSDNSVSALGGLEDLMRDYVVEDYLRDAKGHNVVATVHIEALWDAEDPVGETRWLESLDKSNGVAIRYVAAAPLGTPRAADIIAAQAAFERVVGIRGILSCHPDPQKSFVQRPDLAYDEDWRRDIALLQKHGLNLELMMYPYQAEAVRDLAAAFPNLQIIVNHCGSPIDRDAEGMQRWRDGLRLVAQSPNIALKISNPGIYDRDWTLDSLRDVVMHCIDCFGVERSMFGTDYPVARLNMTFDQIYDNFKCIVEPLSPDEQKALFHDTAARSYRL